MLSDENRGVVSYVTFHSVPLGFNVLEKRLKTIDHNYNADVSSSRVPKRNVRDSLPRIGSIVECVARV